MIDWMSFGLSDRRKECSILKQDAESVEDWIINWWKQLISELDLPPKFFLAGHSMGGFQAALIASVMPERIESLFLISPANMEPYDASTYDPYADPDIIDTLEVSTKKQVDEWLRQERENLHTMKDWHGKLPFMVDMWARKF